MKRFIKVTIISIVMFSLLFTVQKKINAATVALITWDLVDSGKHMDWAADTKYLSVFTTSVGVWEAYKPGIIRKDTAFTIKDLDVSDYNEVSTTAAVASPSGTIKFNDYVMPTWNAAAQQSTAMHEIGHCLRLGHNTVNDVMYAYYTEVIVLTANDKASYDAAYLNY